MAFIIKRVTPAALRRGAIPVEHLKRNLAAVLGELLAGVVIGNLRLVGLHVFDGVRDLPSIDVLAQIGVHDLLHRQA